MYAHPTQGIHKLIILSIKVYVNSILAMFNVRRRLKASFTTGNIVSGWDDAANMHGQPDQIRFKTVTLGGDVSQESERGGKKSSIIEFSPSKCPA